jgi:hypothetical protein
MMVKRTLSVCTGQGKRQEGIVKYVFFGVHAEFLLHREWATSLEVRGIGKTTRVAAIA